MSFDLKYSRLDEALYVTERAVFRWSKGRFQLIEVSPGIQVERDVLGQMEFRPQFDLNVIEATVY